MTLAVYYHIKNRTSERQMDIFDEKLHPLTKDGVPPDYSRYNPDHRQVYKFVRTLFNAAQLTAECAIITLIYLERCDNEFLLFWIFVNVINFQVIDIRWDRYYTSELETSCVGCHFIGLQSLGWSSCLECWLLPNSQRYHCRRHVSIFSYYQRISVPYWDNETVILSNTKGQHISVKLPIQHRNYD